MQERSTPNSWEAVVRRKTGVSVKKDVLKSFSKFTGKRLFLTISQNLQENARARVSFLIKMQMRPATLLKKDSGTGVFL